MDDLRYSPHESNTAYLRGFYARLTLADMAEMRAAARVGLSPEVAREPGRNEPCCCGSGRKFKRCCGA